MRDIALTLVVSCLLVYALRRHYVAPLIWVWLGMMNPHRLTFGFAYHLPFAQVTALLTIGLLMVTKERYPYPKTPSAVLLILFYIWVCITSLASFNTPEVVFDMWMKVTKIQIMLFITLMMLRGREHITALVWVLVVSIGFFGVKGGIWTIMRGGNTMVLGPPGSFIEGTNHIALAMMMVIPLMYYLTQVHTGKWIRYGLWAAMIMTMMGVLGTTSRGALLATVTMATLLGLKSRHPFATIVVLAVALLSMFAFMPDAWINKMESIQTYEDHSAQSRLYTWKMIWNLAMHHPITGGGYVVTENPATWMQYAVTDYWAKAYGAHSIYFQALAEHGFVGLALYLLIGITAWFRCSRIVKLAKSPELLWAAVLARMLQTAIAGFAVGGLFVNLVNFDLPYYFVALVILTDLAVQAELAKPAASPAPAPAAGPKQAAPASRQPAARGGGPSRTPT